MKLDQQICREVAEELRRCGAHHLPVNNGSAIFAASILEQIARRIDHYEQKMFQDEYDAGSVAELYALASAGLHPLGEPALAAGAGTAETNEDLAQSEGRQSGGRKPVTPTPSPSHIPLMNKDRA